MREIRSRIKAVKSTGKITRAMQLVAASKMKKAQSRAEAGHPYSLLLMDLIDMLDPMMERNLDEFGLAREGGRRLIIVFSTDKGLAGALNTNLFKLIAAQTGDCSYIAVGAKAAKFISGTRRKLLAQFKISDSVNFSELRPVVEFAIKEFREKRVDTIEILYSAYINTIRQEPQIVKVAPVDNLKEFVDSMREKYKADIAERPVETREIQFEPSAKELLQELPIYYIKNVVYQMALDAKASEQSARMIAMKNASDNAQNLIDTLSLEYNKARQSAITTEITEIAAAAAASAE